MEIRVEKRSLLMFPPQIKDWWRIEVVEYEELEGSLDELNDSKEEDDEILLMMLLACDF